MKSTSILKTPNVRVLSDTQIMIFFLVFITDVHELKPKLAPIELAILEDAEVATNTNTRLEHLLDQYNQIVRKPFCVGAYIFEGVSIVRKVYLLGYHALYLGRESCHHDKGIEMCTDCLFVVLLTCIPVFFGLGKIFHYVTELAVCYSVHSTIMTYSGRLGTLQYTTQ